MHDLNPYAALYRWITSGVFSYRNRQACRHRTSTCTHAYFIHVLTCMHAHANKRVCTDAHAGTYRHMPMHKRIQIYLFVYENLEHFLQGLAAM